MSRRGGWILPGLLGGVMVGIATADARWLPIALAGVGAAALATWLAAGVATRSREHGVRRPWLIAAAWLASALMVGMLVGGVRGTAAAPPRGPGSVDSMPAGEEVRVLGVVAEEPTPRGDQLDLVLEDLRLADRTLSGRLLVRVPRSVSATAGDQVAIAVTVRPPDAADPDEVAYRERLRRQGIGAMGSAWELSVVGHRPDPVGDAFAAARHWLLDGLVRTVPEPEASLGAGILLGVRAGIDPAVRDAFAVAGLSHVVAISGWNVAIVVALIITATRRLRERFGPRVPAVVAAVAVAGYVILVGGSPAVVRAALMAGALMASRLGGSPAHAASALMAAVLVMLVVTPGALWDIGFQLSALATAGLIVLAAPLEARLGRWPAWVRTPVALTVAAQLATLPVLLATFEQVSLVAPLANVIVVPLIPAVMAGSAAAAVAGGLAASVPLPLVADAGSWLAGGAAWIPLRGLIVAGTAAAAVPLAAVPAESAPWFTAAWYPCLALAVLRLRRGRSDDPPTDEPLVPVEGTARLALPEAAAFTTSLAWLARPRRAAALVALIVAMGTAITGPDGRLHLTVLDIGQGDAILIEAPDGATALIDGGVDPDLTLRQIGRVLPFHQRQLDVLVLTHPHQDHLGGLEEVLRRYDVDLFVDGGRPARTTPHERLLAAAQREPGAHILVAEAGRSIPLGPATLEILFPSAADQARPPPDDDINNASIVILLRYRGFQALLTGDAESPVEALLAERSLLQPIDVLKVGHHGSESSSTPAFLAAIRPSLAIVSAGLDNDYGHPHQATLEHLAQVPGLRLLRTDRDGSVEVSTDGATMWVTSARGQLGPIPVSGALPLALGPGSIGSWQFADRWTHERLDPACPRRRRVPDRPRGGRLRRAGGRGGPRGPRPRAHTG